MDAGDTKRRVLRHHIKPEDDCGGCCCGTPAKPPPVLPYPGTPLAGNMPPPPGNMPPPPGATGPGPDIKPKPLLPPIAPPPIAPPIPPMPGVIITGFAAPAEDAVLAMELLKPTNNAADTGCNSKRANTMDGESAEEGRRGGHTNAHRHRGRLRARSHGALRFRGSERKERAQVVVQLRLVHRRHRACEGANGTAVSTRVTWPRHGQRSMGSGRGGAEITAPAVEAEEEVE